MKKIRKKVNHILNESDLETLSLNKVYHFHQILYDKIGLDEIKKRIKVDMSSIKVSSRGIDPTSLGLNTIHKIKTAALLQKVVADNRCRLNF